MATTREQSRPSPLAVAAESETLIAAAGAAVRSAANALSQMAGKGIVASEIRLRVVPLSHLAMVAGDPERAVVAVYLGVGGDVPGHILLAFSESMAAGLVDLLLDQPEGTTEELGALEISALAEAGNVAGSAFLNTLASLAEMTLPPTPPVVIYEMRGAILDTLAAEMTLVEQDEAMVIEARFAAAGQTVDVAFFTFPGEAVIEAISSRQRAEARW